MDVLLKRWVMRDGERALVSECDARGVPGATGTNCLICETEAAIRRIWSYPADWHRLEDATVFALFDQPFVVISPAKPPSQLSQPRPRRGDGSQSGGPIEATAWR